MVIKRKTSVISQMPRGRARLSAALIGVSQIGREERRQTVRKGGVLDEFCEVTVNRDLHNNAYLIMPTAPVARTQ